MSRFVKTRSVENQNPKKKEKKKKEFYESVKTRSLTQAVDLEELKDVVVDGGIDGRVKLVIVVDLVGLQTQ
jgi:hypothetical protein